MRSKQCVEEVAMKLAAEGRHAEACALLDRDILRRMHQSTLAMQREMQWDKVKRDISSVAWFPVKAIAFIICSPLECVIRIIEAVKKNA